MPKNPIRLPVGLRDKESAADYSAAGKPTEKEAAIRANFGIKQPDLTPKPKKAFAGDICQGNWKLGDA